MRLKTVIFLTLFKTRRSFRTNKKSKPNGTVENTVVPFFCKHTYRGISIENGELKFIKVIKSKEQQKISTDEKKTATSCPKGHDPPSNSQITFDVAELPPPELRDLHFLGKLGEGSNGGGTSFKYFGTFSL